MNLKAVYEEYHDVPCTYNFTEGYIAGYKDEWLIIGFRHTLGCIAKFTDQVTYNDAYSSYRFADPNKVKINLSDIKVKPIVKNDDTGIEGL